jgi:MSHA pilin protein MshC
MIVRQGTYSRGFTIVELIVTMVIVGIMAVVVVPRFSLLGGFDSRGMRDQTIATLRYAQKSALAQRRHVCVVIDASSDIALTIAANFSTATPACPLGVALAYPAGNCPASKPAVTMCRPTRVNTVLGAGTIVFDPSGRPVSGLGQVTVMDGSTAETPITVEAETGYVH